MRRALIATSADWDGTARLPSLLSRAGLEVDLLAPDGFLVGRSSHLQRHIPVAPDVREIAGQAIRCATEYDRVIVADEALLLAIAAEKGPAAGALLPARDAAVLLDVMDKTRFPVAAARHGIPVPEGWVVRAPSEPFPEAARAFPVVVKAAMGQAGVAVRFAPDEDGLRAAIEDLPGPPWMVQRFVDGRLFLAACLFERGRLAAAFVAEKVRTRGRFGPSAVNRLLEVPADLLGHLQRIGDVFGLHGFAGIDFMIERETGRTLFLEVNPRPIPQLHLGRRVGVDMSAALRGLLDGCGTGAPATPRRSGVIAPLFPQEVARCRAARDRAGLARCALDVRLWRDLPWGDAGLMRAYARGRHTPPAKDGRQVV